MTGVDWLKFPGLLDHEDEITEQGITHAVDPTFGKSFASLIHDTTISDGACRLYAHMHWRYGLNKKNFEGRKGIAEFLGVTQTTITKRIKELEAADWIVVVERKSMKKGVYLTPFYHVFESQKDCCEFRETYKPRQNETVREKPIKQERKSRKGKGGNPKFKAKLASDTVATQVDAAHRDNSSSHGSPVTVTTQVAAIQTHLDIQTHSISPDGALPTSEPIDLDAVFTPYAKAVEQHGIPETEFDRMVDAVCEVYGIGGEQAKDYAAMLRGTAKKERGKEWGKYRIEGGITADEFRTWAEYYKTVQMPGAILAKEPNQLNGYVMGWIAKGKPKPPTNGHKPTDPLARIPKDIAEADANESAQRIREQREQERMLRHGSASN